MLEAELKVKRSRAVALCRFLLADFILLSCSRLGERKEKSKRMTFLQLFVNEI